MPHPTDNSKSNSSKASNSSKSRRKDKRSSSKSSRSSTAASVSAAQDERANHNIRMSQELHLVANEVFHKNLMKLRVDAALLGIRHDLHDEELNAEHPPHHEQRRWGRKMILLCTTCASFSLRILSSCPIWPELDRKKTLSSLIFVP